MEDLASRQIANERSVPSWHCWDAFSNPPVELKIGCGVAKYGQKFVWSELHKTAEELAPLRLVGDRLMDAACAEVGASGREVGACVVGASESDGTACGRCLADASRLPAWVDLDRVGRGQLVYQRYAPHVSLTLFYLSLVGGFSAAASAGAS